MKRNSILKRLISNPAIAATITLSTLISAQCVYAGGAGPIRCNGMQSGSAVANSGNAIKKFNNYGGEDSMTEILNQDGRPERFWLDRVDNYLYRSIPSTYALERYRAETQPYGRIRTAFALSSCTGFAWSEHYDFAGGMAKEMVVGRLIDGRLIVVIIGTDDAIYWRSQLGPGSIWSPGWSKKEGIYKNLRIKSFNSGSYGVSFNVEQFDNNTRTWVPNDSLQFTFKKFIDLFR